MRATTSSGVLMNGTRHSASCARPIDTTAKAARRPRNARMDETVGEKKPGACAGLRSRPEAYFVAWSLFALPLLLFFEAFLSARAFFLSAFVSFFASVPACALGAVSDFGAWANALNANAEATNIATSFLSMTGCSPVWKKCDPCWILGEQRAACANG